MSSELMSHLCPIHWIEEVKNKTPNVLLPKQYLDEKMNMPGLGK